MQAIFSGVGSMPRNSAVIIVGAGVAGLAAACELARSGVRVSILEARERIGGRVFSLRDPGSEFPIELGAEFIHGRPPEIWKLLTKSKAEILEMEGDNWCVERGKLAPCAFFSQVDDLLEKMTPIRGMSHSSASSTVSRRRRTGPSVKPDAAPPAMSRDSTPPILPWLGCSGW